MRADARRNRDRLVATAEAVFAEQGAGASLDEIAKRAGVGPGTLYRHFPTREALQEAVYRGAIEELCDAGDALGGEPAEALGEWLGLLVEHMRARRDLAAALIDSLGKQSEVFRECHVRMHATGGKLVERARAAGELGPQTEARDLLWMAHGIAQAGEGDGGDARVARLLAITLAGLAPSLPSSGKPPSRPYGA